MWRGVAFPFRIENGSTKISEGLDRIYESIYQILLTGLGERVSEPTVGSKGIELIFSISSRRPFILLDIKEKIEELDDRIKNVNITLVSESDGEVKFNIAYTYNAEKYNDVYTVIK